MAEQDLEPILIPVEWHVPDDLASHYATNLVVQHTEHEFNIFFYEIRPPLLIGSPEEVREGLEKVELVRANCVVDCTKEREDYRQQVRKDPFPPFDVRL